LDEYELDNKDKYSRIKNVADRMEGRFRDYFGHNMCALPTRNIFGGMKVWGDF